jgi:hypothetical protein
MMARGPEGERVVMPPALTSVAQGEEVFIRGVKTGKLFQLGQPVLFSAQEFIELCLTFFFFGSQLRANLEQYSSAKGVTFTEAGSAHTKGAE